MFSHIIVADAKVIARHDFVAPLKILTGNLKSHLKSQKS